MSHARNAVAQDALHHTMSRHEGGEIRNERCSRGHVQLAAMERYLQLGLALHDVVEVNLYPLRSLVPLAENFFLDSQHLPVLRLGLGEVV